MIFQKIKSLYKYIWTVGFYTIAIRFFLSCFGAFNVFPFLDDFMLLIGLGFLFLAHLVKDSSIEMKMFQGLLIALGVISYLRSTETAMLQLMLTIVSCDKIENEELAKIYLRFFVPVITALFIYTMIGTVVGYSRHVYAQIADDYVCGFYLGTKSTFSDILVSIVMAVLCLNKTSKLINTAIILVCTFIAFYFQRSKADTAVLLMLLVIIHFPKSFSCKMIDVSVSLILSIETIACALLMFFAHKKIISNVLILIGRTFYVRFMSAYKIYKWYGITIFGNTIDFSVIKSFKTPYGFSIDSTYLDSFFSKALVSYGFIFLIVLCVLYYFSTRKLNKDGKRYISYSFAIYTLLLITDLFNIFPIIGFNALMFKNGFNLIDEKSIQ